VGEPVYAIADGEVIYAGDGLSGYGNVVILRHDRKTTSLYAHNSELKVKLGDQVTKGALVALLGNTGHSTGPHVHFEIRDGDVAVNPRDVLPKSKLGVLEEPAGAVLARTLH
jgi:murein DD-endopeptidase MepM/ murein hydrolase activator NlpD